MQFSRETLGFVIPVCVHMCVCMCTRVCTLLLQAFSEPPTEFSVHVPTLLGRGH